MRIPFFTRRREARESYTEAQIAAAVAKAKGASASDLTATVEAVSRLWEAGFASGRSSAVPPWMMALIGRSLIMRGQFLAWRSRSSGLLPAADHEVYGDSASPDRWRYRLTLPAPSTSITRNADSDRVLHVRVGASVRRPWEGCSPLQNAGASREALAQIERSISEEHSGPVGNIIGVNDPEQHQEPVDEIAVLKGRTILVPNSEMDLAGEGAQGRVPWKPMRIGPAPSDGTVKSREAVERSLLAASGVPVELVQPTSGSDAREGWRRFLFGTIAPAAAILAAELRRIGLDGEIDFAELRASDLAGRSRAYKQLTEAAMAPAEARRLTGLE